MRAPGQSEGGEVSPGMRARVETLDPAAFSEDVLRCREVPSLGWNAAELKLDAVFEHAGMGELAPRTEREGESWAADEVVSGQAAHGKLGTEED